MAGERRLRPELIWRALRRCAELTRAGRHGKVVAEVDRALPAAVELPELEGELLIWKAQALLSMGRGAEAESPARRAWELAPSAHSCYLAACALMEVGEFEKAERMLVLGNELFPDTPQLKIRLAMLLAEEGRLPEALEWLEEIEIGPEEGLDSSAELFVLGLRTNLLGILGLWEEAEDVLRYGLERFPGNSFLEETGATLDSVRKRNRAGDRLAELWASELEELPSPQARDVDEAVLEVGRALEIPRLTILAARRLWRAFWVSESVSPRAVEAWGLALILAVTRLDGLEVTAARTARAIRVSEGTVWRALRRVTKFLDGLEPRFARRQFAAMTNPRLEEGTGEAPVENGGGDGEVVRFPGSKQRGG